jgi:hypothetical protein
LLAVLGVIFQDSLTESFTCRVPVPEKTLKLKEFGMWARLLLMNNHINIHVHCSWKHMNEVN